VIPRLDRYGASTIVGLSLLLEGCPLTLNEMQIDWPATGAMLGGLGSMLAATGTFFIILHTYKYVRINRDLLALNRESLEALLKYVAATQDMAQLMRQQTAIAAADVDWRVGQEHEPFRHLLELMIAGCERVRDADLIEAFLGSNLNLRPSSSWFLPPDYLQKVEAAKNFDGALHLMLARLNEPPDGELYRMQLSLGELGHMLRSEFAEVPPQARHAAEAVKREAAESIDALRKAFAYIDSRSRLQRAPAQAL